MRIGFHFLIVHSSWIERNIAMYEFVEVRLRSLYGDSFTLIHALDDETSQVIASDSIREFGGIIFLEDSLCFDLENSHRRARVLCALWRPPV